MLKLYYCAAAAIVGALIGVTAPASWQSGAVTVVQTTTSVR